jgi:hypothetical protein
MKSCMTETIHCVISFFFLVLCHHFSSLFLSTKRNSFTFTFHLLLVILNLIRELFDVKNISYGTQKNFPFFFVQEISRRIWKNKNKWLKLTDMCPHMKTFRVFEGSLSSLGFFFCCLRGLALDSINLYWIDFHRNCFVSWQREEQWLKMAVQKI